MSRRCGRGWTCGCSTPARRRSSAPGPRWKHIHQAGRTCTLVGSRLGAERCGRESDPLEVVGGLLLHPCAAPCSGEVLSLGDSHLGEVARGKVVPDDVPAVASALRDLPVAAVRDRGGHPVGSRLHVLADDVDPVRDRGARRRRGWWRRRVGHSHGRRGDPDRWAVTVGPVVTVAPALDTVAVAVTVGVDVAPVVPPPLPAPPRPMPMNRATSAAIAGSSHLCRPPEPFPAGAAAAPSGMTSRWPEPMASRVRV